MAMGVPVVTTTIAADGVDVVPGEHLLVADDAATFAEAVVKLMQDRRERRRLSNAARARVMSHHHWPNSMRRMEAILERAMARRHGEGQITNVATDLTQARSVL